LRTLLSTEFVQNSGLAPRRGIAVNILQSAADPDLGIIKPLASFLRMAINLI
jgi:hypothetical protein